MKEKLLKNVRLLEIIPLIIFILLLDILLSLKFDFKIYSFYYIISLASILFIPSLIILVKNNKVRLGLYITYLAIIFILFITDSCLFYYKEDIFSWPMLHDIGDGLTMGIKYNLFIAFNAFTWIIIFLLFGLTIYSLSLLVVKKTGNSKFKLSYLLFVILAFLTKGIYIKAEDKQVYDSPQDKRTYLYTFGFSTFNQKDLVNSFESIIFNSKIKATATKKLDELSGDLKAESYLFGSEANKNIIMIMTETVEEYAMDPILTPTLYRLYHSGYYFTNTYGVAKTNYTYDAEFKALTSMMYYNNDNLMHSFAKNEFNNSLPSILKKNGYTVNAFHSFYRDYFNRDEMYQALGFQQFYAYEDMVFSEVDFWPLDSEFFAQNLDLIAPVQDDLFYSFLVTLSTHGDFRTNRTEFNEYYELIKEDGRFANHETEFINLLAAQIDLDKGLEFLIADLEAKDLLDDTLIVMFSDHKNYSSIEITKKYTQLKNNYLVYNYEYDIIPFVIYNPSIETVEITTLSSQYDIMPTICDLLGINLVDDYYYGNSVFLAETNPWPIKPIILGYNRWISPELIVYDKEIVYIDSNIIDSENYIVHIQREVYKTIEKFHSFFICDYFKDK